MKRTPFVLLIAFFALFLGVGLTMLGIGGRAWWKSSQVEAWPTAQGEFLERELAEDSDSDSTTYRVSVRYAYRVAGRRYESERLAFGYTGSSGRGSHQAIHDKLMRGETVLVRYNPADPAEAVLAYGLNHSTLMLIIFGAVWTVFTSGLMLLIRIGSLSDTGLIERLIVQ
jgi:hypothetical protein